MVGGEGCREGKEGWGKEVQESKSVKALRGNTEFHIQF